MSGNSKHPLRQRHIVFIGETGSGKSSAINLLLKTASASVSNDSQPCTESSTSYKTTLCGTMYHLWDSRGLGEGRNLFQALFGGSSEKALKKLLKERHSRQEIDLVVFCIRGSRATEAARDCYKKLCVPTRRWAAPVIVMVTQLEKEKDMEDWWKRNGSRFEELGMEFDGHVCITTLAAHPRLTESREKLVDAITRYRRWEPEDIGSYFGSVVSKKSTSSAPQRKGGIWGLFKAGTTDVGYENRRPSNYPPSTVPSTTGSSYYTAGSPVESALPSPVVEPPTPDSATTVKLPPINTQLPEVDRRPQSSGEDTSSGSSLSMFHPSSDSSCTSYSEVYLESCTEENGDSPTELPFRLSTSNVRRRRSWASRNGAFGDVWECDLISGESTRVVAVKAVRINTNSNGYEDLRSHEKKLRRELKVWGKLRHKNVVPLLGVVSGFGPLPSTVSPWFCRGSLSCYLAHHQVSPSEKHRLLGDIAVGLCYVHSQDVVHGDLHSGNVLIDDDGTACITDFGLSFINDFVGTSYLKSSICGGVNFADPALVKRAYNSQDDVFYPTKPCDIYSFGGLVLHVLSGRKPFEGIPPPNIFVTVLKGERPQIPNHDERITHWHKSLIRACWTHEERKRPSANDLLKKLDRQ